MRSCHRINDFYKSKKEECLHTVWHSHCTNCYIDFKMFIKTYVYSIILREKQDVKL